MAFDGSRTSFALLAQRQQHHVNVFCYVFDLMWLEGSTSGPRGLRTRKRLLRSSLSFRDGVRLTPYRNAEGRSCSRRRVARAGRG